MFPTRYFPDAYFAPRYWPKQGAGGPLYGAWVNVMRITASRSPVEIIGKRDPVEITRGDRAEAT